MAWRTADIWSPLAYDTLCSTKKEGWRDLRKDGGRDMGTGFFPPSALEQPEAYIFISSAVLY